MLMIEHDAFFNSVNLAFVQLIVCTQKITWMQKVPIENSLQPVAQTKQQCSTSTCWQLS